MFRIWPSELFGKHAQSLGGVSVGGASFFLNKQTENEGQEMEEYDPVFSAPIRMEGRAETLSAADAVRRMGGRWGDIRRWIPAGFFKRIPFDV